MFAAAEQGALLCFRLLPHAATTIIVAASPSAFRHAGYHIMALCGMTYLTIDSWMHARRTLPWLRAVTTGATSAVSSGATPARRQHTD
jgi:hypothetical protein